MKSYQSFFFSMLLAVLLFPGCQTPEKNQADNTATFFPVADSSSHTSCSYLTQDAAGRPVISWVQQSGNGKTSQVYYATFSDSSKTFGEPKVIPTSADVEPHGENMPKIIFQKNGHIMVVYGIKNPQPGNAYTGAIYYTRSFDNGQHWTTARPLVTDTAASFDQRYFDIALLPDGNIGIIWLNNSMPAGSTLYFAATRGDEGFGAWTVVGKHACQCCRTDLLVDSSGTMHVAWRDIIQDSIRDMVYCSSKDTGKTFSTPMRISADNWVVNGCPHTGPSMAVNKEGIHFSWFTMGGGGGVYYCHTDNGSTFSTRQSVSQLPSARHPQIAALPNSDLAIVWDEGVKYGNAIHQRIGLQLRGPDGLLLNTRYLTPDSINVTFPQIKVLDDQHAIVSFTENSGKREQVKYRQVSIAP